MKANGTITYHETDWPTETQVGDTVEIILTATIQSIHSRSVSLPNTDFRETFTEINATATITAITRGAHLTEFLNRPADA